MVVLEAVASHDMNNEKIEEPVIRKKFESYEFCGKEKMLIRGYQSNLQYVHIYTTRLNSLRPRVQKAMEHRLSENLLNSSSISANSAGSSASNSPRKGLSSSSPSKQPGSQGGGSRVALVSISAIRPDRKYAVIGTIQKRQPLKPSILKEVSEEHNLEPPVVRETFVDSADQVYIEDETQSLALTGNIDTQNLCNGVVVGVIGKENSEGEFHVDEIFYPLPATAENDDLSPSKKNNASEILTSGEAKKNISNVDEDDSFVMFVSGLNVGGDYESVLLDMLASFVTGDCGPLQDIASKIVRVVVCGNSLDSRCVDKALHSQALYLSKKSTLSSVLPLQTLDCLLQQVASSCSVDLMPGETDPGTAFMPQQPLHKCMFPKATTFTSFNTVTNPYHFKLNDCDIIGCSGQNLKDIARYSTVTDPLCALELTLKCQLTCPTAPDTLPCYPLGKSKQDPFVIEAQPRIYFAGNCEALQYKHLDHSGSSGNDKQLLLCVPTFSKSKEAVLVSLNDLKVTPICFGDILIE